LDTCIPLYTKNSHQDAAGTWILDSRRDITLIKADVDTWFSWYSIDGIFYDEVTSFWPPSFETKADALPVTHSLIQYAKNRGASILVVLNPGTFFDPEIVDNYDDTVKAIINEFPVNFWWPTIEGATKVCQKNELAETFGVGPFCAVRPDLANSLRDG
jgi:hypothetical protein